MKNEPLNKKLYNQPIDRQSDETRLTGELDHILTGLWHDGYNRCNVEKNHPDGYDNYAYSINSEEAIKQILDWHETEKKKTVEQSYANGFIDGYKFGLSEILNHAAYARRKTIDTKTVIRYLSDFEDEQRELNKSKGGKI